MKLYEIAGVKDSEFASLVFGQFTSKELADKALELLPEEYADEVEIRQSNLAVNTIEVDGRVINVAGPKSIISVDTKAISETEAIWLCDLLKKEMEEALGAADNEHTFALGSDDEESAYQHETNADENREYAGILRDAYNDVQRFWGKYAEYLPDDKAAGAA